jgi:hypothetical protein
MHRKDASTDDFCLKQTPEMALTPTRTVDPWHRLRKFWVKSADLLLLLLLLLAVRKRREKRWTSVVLPELCRRTFL